MSGDAIIAGLGASDATALVAAIERAGDALARDGLAPHAAEHVAHAIARHASHARSTVRKAVAEVAQHLTEDAFESVISGLLDDANQFVKRAATRAYDDWSRARRVERAHEEQSATMRELRARIDDDFGREALRAADRLRELRLGAVRGAAASRAGEGRDAAADGDERRADRGAARERRARAGRGDARRGWNVLGLSSVSWCFGGK